MTTVITMIMIVTIMTPIIVMAATMTVKTKVTGSTLILINSIYVIVITKL